MDYVTCIVRILIIVFNILELFYKLIIANRTTKPRSYTCNQSVQATEVVFPFFYLDFATAFSLSVISAIYP